MNLKGIFKFSLCAVLVSAGAVAFADVQLSNGTTKTWAEFSAAVSDLDAITGNISDLPSSNKIGQAYANAQTAESDAETTLNEKNGIVTAKTTAKTTADNAAKSAQTAVTTAEGLVAQKKTALETAQASLTAAYAAYVKTFQDQLDQANAQLTQKENTDLPKLESALDKLTDQKTSVESSLSSAKNTLASLQAQYNGLAKVKGPLPWLAKIDSVATDWYTAQRNVTSDASIATANRKAPLYAKEVTGKDFYGDDVSELHISFSAPSDLTGWTTCNTLTQWTNFLGTINFAAIEAIYVNMGADYASKNGGNSELVVTKPTKKADILTNIYNAVHALTSQSNYQGNTGAYEDPEAEQNLRTQITEQQAEVNRLSIQLYGAHPDSEGKLPYGATEETNGINDNITSTNTQIETLEGEIKTLKETDIPALQTAVQNAQDAVKNETATSDAITAAKTAVSEAQTAVDNAQDQLDTDKATLEEKETAAATAKNELDAATADAAKAQTAYDNAAAALATAKTNAQNEADRIAQSHYNNVTLTSDLTVSTPVNASYAGTINGKNYCISFSNGATQVFDGNFTGVLSNAAINYPAGGKFANQISDAKFEDVATWNGTSGSFYDQERSKTTYTSLGQLGMAAREYFGANLATSKLANKDEYKVYNITVYKMSGNEQAYVNLVDNKFSNGSSTVNIPDNTFVSSATADDEIANAANLVYKEGDNWKANNVVIEDKTNFYAPFQVQAASVTVNRKFNSGYNTVCLPFELSTSDGDIQYLCTYDTEADGKFWFTKHEGSIEANTPLLMVANNGFDNLYLSEATIEATESQVIEWKGQTPEQNKSFGTFKLCNVDEFNGGYNSYKVFGLKGQVFTAAGTGSTFPAFRTVISSDQVTRTSNDGPRRIGIRDERGIEINDVVTGVENVQSDEVSFSVNGGMGVIRFTADADYGMVDIYSIDGKLITVAEVLEGTTTVDVQHGVYIVMGKKVLVK